MNSYCTLPTTCMVPVASINMSNEIEVALSQKFHLPHFKFFMYYKYNVANFSKIFFRNKAIFLAKISVPDC
jgi:hypothetical protein